MLDKPNHYGDNVSNVNSLCGDHRNRLGLLVIWGFKQFG